ncbi:MAG TPA: carbamate kinase [Polyangiales bacterium]|nr:carbamate kinase [Polyangiales bacterium]
MTAKTAVVAFGGNALVSDAEHDSIPAQYETVCRTIAPLVDLVQQGWRLVVSHGNGPQVGFILRRSELSQAEVDPVPVDYAVADTQGAIGYMFVKALSNELARRDILRPVVAIVTQCVVDPADPAFKRPTKPIGSFLSEATARARQQALGWTIMEDAGRGFRRTLPSPRPQRIVESATIRTLLDAGAVVIAAGGGGIPVARAADGSIVGVEAVIDKDLASGLLAKELAADLLLIPTGVSRVAIHFGKPTQKWLDTLTVEDARAYLAAGEFGAGSMEPKIAAVADFVASTPHAFGAIGSPDELAAIIDGRAGTRIIGRQKP